MIKNNHVLASALIATPLALMSNVSTAQEKSGDTGKKTNILILLADDMGWGDPGCYNPESKIPTPNIDKLAEEGVRFTDAHTAGATCNPSRYGLLTGRFQYRDNWKREPRESNGSEIATDRLTLPAMLKKQGYQTACIGKWHLGYKWKKRHDQIIGGPTACGFDYYFGTLTTPNHPPFCFFENDKPIAPLGQYTYTSDLYPYKMKGLGTKGWKFEESLTTLTDKAVDYIKNKTNKQSPFFLYIAFPTPHTPICPSKDFIGKTDADSYGDLCHETDASVGRILKALKASGKMDNTIVVFASDNGSPARSGSCLGAKFNTLPKATGHNPNVHWRGIKGTCWEGGHRVPFIVRWPGKIKAATVNDNMLCLSDLFASFAKITDYKLSNKDAIDSFNMLPELLDTNNGKPVRTHMLNHCKYRLCAVRDGDWKLIFGLSSGWPPYGHDIKKSDRGEQGQLYNLKKDPSEKNNLWVDMPERVKTMSKILARYKAEARSAPLRARQ